jgi:hypothetical protein
MALRSRNLQHGVLSFPGEGDTMPYSLVSAATLGFDLVRIPAGRFAADALLTGLVADDAAFERLAAAHPGNGLDREQRGVLAVRSRKARELAAAVPQVRHARAGGGRTDAERTAVLVAQLEQGTIGDAPTLERLLRDDVLGPEHPVAAGSDRDRLDRAADVLADAAIGWWSAGVLPPLVRRELTEPFERAGVAPADPAAVDLGPGTGELRSFLDGLRASDAGGRAAWRTAVDLGRADHRSWATAMHEASWAAHVSGRTRTLATAQLFAVQAFLDAGFDGRDGAHGVWNAVAGCVQAHAMADLLDAGSLTLLTGPQARLG